MVVLGDGRSLVVRIIALRSSMQDERAVVNEGDAMHAQPARSALRSVLLGLGAGLGERAVDGIGGKRHDHDEGRVVLGIVASV